MILNKHGRDGALALPCPFPTTAIGNNLHNNVCHDIRTQKYLLGLPCDRKVDVID